MKSPVPNYHECGSYTSIGPADECPFCNPELDVEEPYDDWLDRNYTGAPDECSIHWPVKAANCLKCEVKKADVGT